MLCSSESAYLGKDLIYVEHSNQCGTHWNDNLRNLLYHALGCLRSFGAVAHGSKGREVHYRFGCERKTMPFVDRPLSCEYKLAKNKYLPKLNELFEEKLLVLESGNKETKIMAYMAVCSSLLNVCLFVLKQPALLLQS